MKLIVTEKNIAAKKLAEILAVGKPKTDKVYNTPIYTFRRDGEDWVSIGLKGHILGVDFPQQVVFDGKAWKAVWEDDAIKAPVAIPDTLPTPATGLPTDRGARRSRLPLMESTSRRGSSSRCRI